MIRVSFSILTQNDTKTIFRLPLKLSLLRGSRPKSAMTSPQHLAHNVPNLTQIGSLSSFDGVIAGRVKAVKTRLKVFPILGEAIASRRVSIVKLLVSNYLGRIRLLESGFGFT